MFKKSITYLMKKILLVVFVLFSIISIMPETTYAEVQPPASFGAPKHFGAKFNYSSFKFYVAAPDDMREFMAKRAADDPDKSGLYVYYQVDCKVNDGDWQYTSEWDSPSTAPDDQDHNGNLSATFNHEKFYAYSGYGYLDEMLPNYPDEIKKISDMGWEYFKTNKITFRARFAHSFDGKNYVLSPWSKEFVLSANTVLDYNKMINNAPVIKEAVLVMDGNKPKMAIKVEKPPVDIGELNVAAGGNVAIDIWLRKIGDKDFKYIHYWWVSDEYVLFDASDYFEDYKDHYEAAAFEIKARYRLDLRSYFQANVNSSNSVDIYSPFSNIVSQNMPAWSEASAWATPELKKAEDMGLIPDMLKGTDMTKPITRREFAAVSVKLYEKLSGNTATPVATNPFKDTNDIEVLKAYNVGVTDGVAADKFDPDKLLNREHAATMLTRVFKKTFVEGWSLKEDSKFTFNYTMPPKFADDAKISDWAKPSVYFMVSHEIIKGIDSKNFGPKATTTAEQAKNYASATREQSLIIATRMAENLNKNDAKEIIPPAPSSQGSGLNKDLIGEWASGGGVYNFEVINGNASLGDITIANGEYYQFNEDGTFRYIIYTLGGYIGYTYYDSTIVYDTGKYKIDGNNIIFTDYSQTYYKGTPLALVYKDKKMDKPYSVEIEEFNKDENKFKTITGWLYKKQ